MLEERNKHWKKFLPIPKPFVMFTFKTDEKKGECRKYSLQLQPTQEQVCALSTLSTPSACTSHSNVSHCLLFGIVLFPRPFFTRHESSGIVEITISRHEEVIFRMMFPILISGFLVTIINAFKVNTFRGNTRLANLLMEF